MPDMTLIYLEDETMNDLDTWLANVAIKETYLDEITDLYAANKTIYDGVHYEARQTIDVNAIESYNTEISHNHSKIVELRELIAPLDIDFPEYLKQRRAA